jgi:hypothetical protein
MYFSNEYPKHAPNMQNIHETRNGKKLILLNPSKRKMFHSTHAYVLCV